MNIEIIHKSIKAKKIDAFFVTNLKNLFYLTGFTGSSGYALITKDKFIFFTDFRYKEQAMQEVKKCEIIIEKGKRGNLIKRIIKRLKIKKLGFETTISYSLFELLNKTSVELLPIKNLIERFRKIKTEEEINNIKEAIKRAEKAYLKVKPFIKIGIKEREIAIRLEYQLKAEGCFHIPFDIIVASGKNSAMPHAKPSDKIIKEGDFVIIDWGGESNGYYSDMTRTLLIDGKELSEKIKIYNIVNDARERAIKTIRIGIKAKEIDLAAREVIKKEGYSECFGHSTGHGVGLDVHELPYISSISSEMIQESMVFTIEPGIYIPELGGVRIEDMVLIKDGYSLILTSLSRDIEIIKSN